MTIKATTIVVRFYAKPGMGSKLMPKLVSALPRITRLEACLGGSLYHDIDAPDTIVLIEHWVSVEAHRAFVKGLEDDGTMADLEPFLAKAPVRRYLTTAD